MGIMVSLYVAAHRLALRGRIARLGNADLCSSPGLILEKPPAGRGGGRERGAAIPGCPRPFSAPSQSLIRGLKCSSAPSRFFARVPKKPFSGGGFALGSSLGLLGTATFLSPRVSPSSHRETGEPPSATLFSRGIQQFVATTSQSPSVSLSRSISPGKDERAGEDEGEQSERTRVDAGNNAGDVLASSIAPDLVILSFLLPLCFATDERDTSDNTDARALSARRAPNGAETRAGARWSAA